MNSLGTESTVVRGKLAAAYCPGMAIKLHCEWICSRALRARQVASVLVLCMERASGRQGCVDLRSHPVSYVNGVDPG